MNINGKSLLLIIGILVSLVLSACGNIVYTGNREKILGTGSVVEESRTVGDISSVELATIGDLHIKVGSSESLTVNAQENLQEYIETKVVGGKLTISVPGNVKLENTKPIDYYLTVTGLDSINLSSVGDIEAPDLTAEHFSAIISSTGSLTINSLNADTLEVDINSTGNLDIAGGEVNTQNIAIDSTGNYSAEDLESDEVDVRINSTGSIAIWAKESLTVKINSTGDVKYYGSPTVDFSGSGTGKVTSLGEK